MTLQPVVYIRDDAETQHLQAFDCLQTEQEHFKQVMWTFLLKKPGKYMA